MEDCETSFFLKQKILCLDIIAQGGYATVFYVYHTQYKSYFALKKVPECRFQETELHCLIGIDDPKIVSLYKYYKFNGSIYLLMEYCPDDLENYLRNHTNISESAMYRYIYGIVTSIKACHDRNISHRDIKPSNFLIDKYDRIKIGDFGLSRRLDYQCNCKDGKGTPLFMSPEILQQRECNPMKGDIWALGITLYFLITGVFPFYATNKDELAYQIERGVYAVERITDTLIRQIVTACLVVDPDNRPTIDEILEMPYFKYKEIPRVKSDMGSVDLIIRPRASNTMKNSLLCCNSLTHTQLKSLKKLRKLRCKSTDVVLSNGNIILPDLQN